MVSGQEERQRQPDIQGGGGTQEEQGQQVGDGETTREKGKAVFRHREPIHPNTPGDVQTVYFDLLGFHKQAFCAQ